MVVARLLTLQLLDTSLETNNQIKRWEANRVSKDPAMLPHEHGSYILMDDYAKLKAENERLRYAGDRMHSKMYSLSFGWKTDEQDAWEAAKKRSDAK